MLGYVEIKGVQKGGRVYEKNRLKNDMYHDNQYKERNPMGEVTNEGVGKGDRAQW
jgi:hypothetical protein